MITSRLQVIKNQYAKNQPTLPDYTNINVELQLGMQSIDL